MDNIPNTKLKEIIRSNFNQEDSDILIDRVINNMFYTDIIYKHIFLAKLPVLNGTSVGAIHYISVLEEKLAQILVKN